MSHISQAKLDLRGTGCVLLAVAGLSLRAWPVLAQQQNDTPPTTGSLVQLLESKGILTPQEAAMVSQASTGGEARERLAQLLVSKRLITQDEYNRIFGAPTVTAPNEGSTGAHPTDPVLLASSSGSPEIGGTVTGNSPASSAVRTREAPIIPAATPVRVLPIDVPKQGGLIPDVRLGSGANIKLYGLFKTSAVEDTASSGGALFGNNDFPLPLLLGDTGPNSNPQFHIKARSFRIGTLFEWVPKNSSLTLTGRLEYDFEGNFTDVNNRNISSVRSPGPSLRLGYARLDTKLGNLPWFVEFGQDWTILGSSTLPDLYETTGLGIGMGSFYERVPQLRTGVQFHNGDVKMQPEVAFVLPAAGSPQLTDLQRVRFGDRAGSDSNRPGVQGRFVVQFPWSHRWVAVAPAQIIVSGGHAASEEIIPAGNLPDTAVAGASGCSEPLPSGGCSIKGFFPKGLNFRTPQNIWTGEFQVPTPWVTLATKYYRGGDMRFYFAGQLNDVFTDLSGVTSVGTATSFTNRDIPFGLLPDGRLVPAALRPVRGQGGFADLSFPLSRIFHADPQGHNAGWVFHLGYGTDRAKAADGRRANGLLRTDLGTASIIYRLNKWVSLVNEVSYIETRAATPGSKIFRGIPATVAHSWRNEFGSAFTF